MLKGVQFKKEAMVLLLADVTHHDPNVWTDPDVFNPNRYVSQSMYSGILLYSYTYAYV